MVNWENYQKRTGFQYKGMNGIDMIKLRMEKGINPDGSEAKTITHKILNVLTITDKPLSIKEIADSIMNGLNDLDKMINLVRVYIWRLEKRKLVKETGKIQQAKLYSIVDQDLQKKKDLELLKDLYELMSNKMDFSETPDNKDIELIKSVKEVIA